MSKDLFTPGPWTVVAHSWSDTSVVSGTHSVCRMSIYDEATEDTQKELEARDTANARLIAAAPELLEALEDALPLMGWSNMSDAEIQHEAGEGNGTAPVIQKMRAAIAKARGDA